MGYGENGPEAFEVDVRRADIVARRHDEPADLVEGGLNRFAGDVEQGILGFIGAGVNEVEDGALRLADDGGVRLGDEVANCGGVPMIAAGEAVAFVHALLDYCPLARFVDHE